jgi:xylan 1,4-beta-xylosidase
LRFALGVLPVDFSLRLSACLPICLLPALCLGGPAFLCGQTSSPGIEGETITIDAQAPSRPFPHGWERMFGSGRAILSLRQSYRDDLRAVKQATDFEYIRFHGILNDDVGLYSTDPGGNPVYNFSYVDQIYDGLLVNGIRPFVEISFMPKALASTSEQHVFWYHPYVAPPKDWNLWKNLIGSFARHLVARYGIDEVSQWYFEVWNEPNIDFWAGEPKQETYLTLYDTTARALKGVSSRLRVGGPATAQAAWVSEFIRYCVGKDVPVDFVSAHVYGNDKAEDVFGSHEQISRLEMVIRAVKKVHDEVQGSPRPGLPIIFSEFNASYMNEADVTDSAFMGPWLAYTISHSDGLVDMLAYWAFSDVFEEQGVVKSPFYGGFGLMAEGNIPKASYNVFALLHRLGTERIAVDSDSVLATKRQDGALVIALWNYAPPEESGPSKKVSLALKGLGGMRHATVSRVDDHHGSALAAWEAMGKPQFPSREQQELLREAGRLPAPEIRQLPSGDPAALSLTLPPHGLVVVEFWK